MACSRARQEAEGSITCFQSSASQRARTVCGPANDHRLFFRRESVRSTCHKPPLATFDLGVEERETKTWSTQERRRSFARTIDQTITVTSSALDAPPQHGTTAGHGHRTRSRGWTPPATGAYSILLQDNVHVARVSTYDNATLTAASQ